MAHRESAIWSPLGCALVQGSSHIFIRSATLGEPETAGTWMATVTSSATTTSAVTTQPAERVTT